MGESRVMDIYIKMYQMEIIINVHYNARYLSGIERFANYRESRLWKYSWLQQDHKSKLSEDGNDLQRVQIKR